MITLTLSASLAALLPDHNYKGENRHCSIKVNANNWAEVVAEIRLKFQRLASHVFDESGQLRPGLLAAVNDDVNARGDGDPLIGPGAEVFLFVQIAGG